MMHRLSSTAHLLTIDVTDWRRDPAIASALRAKSIDVSWDRTEAVVDRLLGLLSDAGARATFFVGASIAKRNGTLPRRITGMGHEIAAHGEYDGADADEFRADARRTKSLLEALSGAHVRGFRSPRSAPLGGMWRFELLVEEGFEYDSSRTSGAPAGRWGGIVPQYAQTLMCGAGSLVEVPRLAAGAGGAPLSVRRASYGAMRTLLASRASARLPGVVSFAAWEVDDAQPRLPLPLLPAIRHYSGRRAAKERVGRLVHEFSFDAVGHRLSELAKDAPSAFAA